MNFAFKSCDFDIVSFFSEQFLQSLNLSVRFITHIFLPSAFLLAI